MTANAVDFLTLAVIIIWPVIPLFWIPVHGFAKVFRRLGLLTYIVPAATWTPLAVLLYSQRDYILRHKTGFPLPVVFFGLLLLSAGAALQVWSGKLLSLKGLMGMPEVSAAVESRFVTTGPYRYVRHPTYLSHTLMFSGLFLVSGVMAMGIVTLLDLLLITLVVIPLEDRELSARFGPAYDEYRRRVPGFFPFQS